MLLCQGFHTLEMLLGYLCFLWSLLLVCISVMLFSRKMMCSIIIGAFKTWQSLVRTWHLSFFHNSTILSQLLVFSCCVRKSLGVPSRSPPVLLGVLIFCQALVLARILFRQHSNPLLSVLECLQLKYKITCLAIVIISLLNYSTYPTGT